MIPSYVKIRIPVYSVVVFSCILIFLAAIFDVLVLGNHWTSMAPKEAAIMALHYLLGGSAAAAWKTNFVIDAKGLRSLSHLKIWHTPPDLIILSASLHTIPILVLLDANWVVLTSSCLLSGYIMFLGLYGAYFGSQSDCPVSKLVRDEVKPSNTA